MFSSSYRAPPTLLKYLRYYCKHIYNLLSSMPSLILLPLCSFSFSRNSTFLFRNNKIMKVPKTCIYQKQLLKEKDLIEWFSHSTKSIFSSIGNISLRTQTISYPARHRYSLPPNVLYALNEPSCRVRVHPDW